MDTCAAAIGHLQGSPAGSMWVEGEGVAVTNAAPAHGKHAARRGEKCGARRLHPVDQALKKLRLSAATSSATRAASTSARMIMPVSALTLLKTPSFFMPRACASLSSEGVR
jgi:hypothetical protein